MSIVFTDAGKLLFLKYMLDVLTPGDLLFMGLFTNNVTPTASDVIGDYNSPTDSGYTIAPIEMTSGSWSFSSSEDIVIATYTGSAPVFTFNSAANIYGITVVNGTDQLIWADRFSDAPEIISSSGGTITISPLSITLS